MLVENFIIREMNCSHKFVDDTKYQYNLIAVLWDRKEIVLTHLFSDAKIEQDQAEDVLLKVIKNNIQWKT